MIRGKINQVQDTRDRIIDGWEALDRGGGWDPEAPRNELASMGRRD